MTWEEKNKTTVYLKIPSFGGRASEMDSVFDEINAKRYANLIVDLRNNTGGSVEAGMAFARNLIDTPSYGGAFLTQKWFNKNKDLPSIGDYPRFPSFSEANFDLILEGIHDSEGLCLKVVPRPETYRGKLFVLTNRRTASTCEPIVYELQRRKRAVIIGDKTAGAMLNGELFELGNGFKMLIPTADYYAVDGYRIDGQGVAPDIVTQPGNALDAAMEMLDSH